MSNGKAAPYALKRRDLIFWSVFDWNEKNVKGRRGKKRRRKMEQLITKQ